MLPWQRPNPRPVLSLHRVPIQSLTLALLQTLLFNFLGNMVSESAAIRRAASDAAIAVCRGSSNPMVYLKVGAARG